MAVALQLVEARQGGHWIAQGWRAIRRHPLALAAILLAFIFITSLLSAIPMIGSAAALVFVPTGTAGFMAAVEQSEAGHKPHVGMLFAPLRKGREQTRKLMLLGAFYATCVLLALYASILVDGGAMLQAYTGRAELTPELVVNPAFRKALGLTMALFLLIGAIFWHAPALVHWYGVPPLKSLFFSSVAIIRNLRAFLLYGAFWFLLALSLSVLSAVAVTGGGAAAAAFVTLLSMALLFMLFFASLWFTFRDCFTASPSNPRPVVEG